jgi:predicted phosphodiesterase
LIAPTGIGSASKALTGQAMQLLLQQGRIAVQVLGHHHQQEIRRAGDGMEHHHFGNCIYRFDEQGVAGIVLVVDGDADKGHHAVPYFSAVKLGPVAGDQSGFFEAPNAPPAR